MEQGRASSNPMATSDEKCGLQHAGEQGVFAYGLRGELGVDTGGAEKQQLLHPVGTILAWISLPGA